MRLLNTSLKSIDAMTGAFLVQLLLSLLLTCYTFYHASVLADDEPNKQSKGEWVVDPANPGPSLPPVGRSLFDFLITSETEDGSRVYDIPFPYEKLIEKLEWQLRKTTPEMPAVKQVLIPLGRSLARNIARPDFFRYPRVVAAVDSPPASNKIRADVQYQDRLYIGYGEKANLLEVISYNEAAGRFEFQIVTNYKEGGEFKVFYANREVCTACHQNGALIFSRQQWDETNANPKIAALLKQQQRSYFGIPIERGVDIPNAIDDATNRANYFALYQKLWQQGCAALNTPQNANENENTGEPGAQQAIHCRADILRYVLQYRLSGDAEYDHNNEYYTQQFQQGLLQNFSRIWPEGLLIPDPDIPNRDPLLMFAKNSRLTEVGEQFTSDASQVLNTMLENNDVPSEFEPLNPRPPLMTWKPSPENIDTFIRGLSGFLTLNDVETLDQHLKLKARIKNHVKAHHDLSCKVTQDQTELGKQRIKFNCITNENNNDPTIKIKGRFYSDKGEFLTGKISRLEYSDAHYLDLTLDTHQILNTTSERSASFRVGNGKLNARLPNGNAIGKLVLHWPAQVASSDEADASAELNILDDFNFIDSAIKAMEDEAMHSDTAALSDKPFRRASIMAALSKQLILPGNDWCCVDDSGMPAAELDKPGATETVMTQAAKPELAPFYRYCSLCHRTNQVMPPNFLQGELTEVEGKLSHCAERIFYRLSMWQFDEAQRGKSPMPPFTALEGLGMTYERWKTSDELSHLKHYVADILQQQTGKTPDINEFMNRGFDNLRSCLP